MNQLRLPVRQTTVDRDRYIGERIGPFALFHLALGLNDSGPWNGRHKLRLGLRHKAVLQPPAALVHQLPDMVKLFAEETEPQPDGVLFSDVVGAVRLIQELDLAIAVAQGRPSVNLGRFVKTPEELKKDVPAVAKEVISDFTTSYFAR
jgi:hypothetical protein